MYEYGRTFYCHKNEKSGLRYKICLNIRTGDIVLVNGPYTCGYCNDINIFRESLVSFLGLGERVEADDGYIGDALQHIKCPMSCTNSVARRIIEGRAKSRQEIVNRRRKCWGILKQVFCHDIPKYTEVMYAIATITQISIENGEQLFQVDYRDV